MRRISIVVVSSLLLSACGGRHEARPDPNAVRKYAEKAFEELQAEERGTIASAPAPETEVKKAKNLGKDPVNDCTWIEAEGLVRVGDQDTRAQAHAAAQAEASKQAMQDFLGVDLKKRGFDYMQESLRGQEQLVESVLQTTRNGRELAHKIVEEGYRDVPGCPACLYHMTYRSCIVPIPNNADRDFMAELTLSRTRFVDGDEAKLKVTATKDCWVYLYDVDMDGATALLVPNEYVPEVHLKSGETWTYPDDEVRRRGIKLVAQMPEGKKISAETIRLIATKVPLAKDRQDPAMGGYEGLLRRMNASRLDWTDDAQAFTIYKN